MHCRNLVVDNASLSNGFRHFFPSSNLSKNQDTVNVLEQQYCLRYEEFRKYIQVNCICNVQYKHIMSLNKS